MHNVVTDRLLTASGEQRKKEHKTGSAVKKPLFPDLNAENWKASGKKFLTLFAVFALLFAILPAHLVAADSSSSSEVETGTGSISGFLWVDGNGILPTDWNGFYDTGEQPLAGYPVYLYAANDLTVHIAQTQTDWDGTYLFENLEPGNYVAGLASSLTDSAEYLLPMSVTGENKFAIDWRSNPIMAFTGTLIVTANGSIENINGGMRLPVGFVPAGITTTTGSGDSGGYSGAAFIMSLPSAWADIDLADSDGSLTSTAWSSYYEYNAATRILTIKQDAPTSTEPVAYRIWQNGAHSVTGIVVNTGVMTSIIIDGITMTGNFDLQGNADVDLLLAGDNTINGSVFVPDRGGTDIATIRIDSATIPGSSAGSLTANATNSNHAVIGGGGQVGGFQAGGNININGGTVTVTARSSSNSSGIGGASNSDGGTIMITGGTVTATSNNGAGIGGGSGGNGGSGGTITITGGTVTVTSSGVGSGAGIGGGSGGDGGNGGSGGTIKITGGTVMATSNWGAGIGGGSCAAGIGGSGGTITITGGTVTATSRNGAGIGGGFSIVVNGGSGGTITITDNAVVTATSNNGAGIGGGDYSGNGGTISITGNAVVTATSNDGGAGIGGSHVGSGAGADITIDSTATVKAYSRLSTRPAIHAETVSGDGFFVNNVINTVVRYDRDIEIFNAGTTNPVTTLTLPANYSCYAYSTGSTETENFNEFMSNSATGDHIGWIVRTSDSSPLIGSVNTPAALPVRLEPNYFIIYNPNGGGPGTGHYQNSGVPCVSGSGTGAAILANTHSSVNMVTGPANMSFTGWNDAPDGSGNTYVAGQTYPINGDNIILYAQWGYDRYLVYDGDVDTGTLIGSKHLLADAVALCTVNNNPYTIVATEDDTDMTNGVDGTISIPAGRDITLTSDTDNQWTITQRNNSRHFNVSGSLTLEDIILAGNGVKTPTGGQPNGGLMIIGPTGVLTMNSGAVIQDCYADWSGGGGVYLSGSSFTMNSGAVIQDCYTLGIGGGGVYLSDSSFTMNSGAVIQDCYIWGSGGGVYLSGGFFTMNSGAVIQDCYSDSIDFGGGGGVFVTNGGSFSMTGGTISDNIASLADGGGEGGGICVRESSTFTMDSGTISGNQAFRGGGVSVNNSTVIIISSTISNNTASVGGGVYLHPTADFTMTGGTISTNTATGAEYYGSGGGIYTSGTNYATLHLSDVIFHSNYAESGAIIPPSNALILYPNIATTSSSIYDHPLNNYDINTAGPCLFTWNVTERYVDMDENELDGERVTYVLRNSPTYSKNHPAIAGYVPVGYWIGNPSNGGIYSSGTPAIIDPVSSNQIVYFVYEEGYTITEKYVDVNGDPINPPGTSATDVLQSSGAYSKTLPTLSGYGAIGWMWEADYLLLSGSDFPITTTTSGFNAGSPSSVAVSDDGTVYFVYAAVLEKVPGQGSGFSNATIVNQQGSSSQPEQGRQQESESGSGSGIKEQQPAGGSETMPGTDYLWLSVILIFLAAIGFYFFFFLWKRRKDDKEKT